MIRQLKKRIRRHNFKQARLLAAVLGAAAVLAASPAAYADQTISGPSGAVTAIGGETVTVTPTGAITNAGGNGITLVVHNNTLISYGTVSGGAVGIEIMGGSVHNNVTIMGGTVSGGIRGINLGGSDNSLTVTGGTVTGLRVECGNTVTIRGGLVRLNNSDCWINGDTAMYGGALAANSAGGAYTIANLAFHGGVLRAGYGATAGNTFNITNLSGGGGSFYLNTNLAAGQSDRISITNANGGSFGVYAANLGGTPANPYATVRLVSVSGVNNASFSGGGDLGAYRYGIAPGSALSAAYTTSGLSSDYYLYNTFAPSAVSRAAMGLSADTAVVWYGELNEIKKRLGDLRMGAQSGEDFWARVYADKFTVRPRGGDSLDQNVRGVELGKDTVQPFTGGKRYTGFLAGVGQADSTFSAGGSGDTGSVYAGAYGSWLRDDGSYFDLVGKYNWFRHSFDTPLFGGGSDSGSYRNTGFGLSAEIGKRIERGHGVYVQPEAELAALWTGSAGYTSANGLAIRVPSTDSLQLRLGCTVGRKWQDGGGTSRQVYGKLSWVNEFQGMSRTVVDSAVFDSSLKGHQWVTGVGFVEDFGSRQLYIDVEKSWGNTVSKAWGVNAGCRWKF